MTGKKEEEETKKVEVEGDRRRKEWTESKEISWRGSGIVIPETSCHSGRPVHHVGRWGLGTVVNRPRVCREP